jgi:xanthine dehydrogenase accessory factor
MIALYEKILCSLENGKSGVLVTVTEKDGFGPGKIGSKMFVTSSMEKTGSIGGGPLEMLVLKDCKEILENKLCTAKVYTLDSEKDRLDSQTVDMLCGGTVKLFFEYIGPKAEIFLFGSGTVGREILLSLSRLDYSVCVFEERTDVEVPEVKFSSKIIKDYIAAIKEYKFPKRGIYIICTYSHEKDYEVLRELLMKKTDAFYIGMLASEKKAGMIVSKIKNENPDVDLSVLYSPIGLDIGGQTPSEIAISVAAQIQAVMYGKQSPGLSRKWSS